MFCQICIIQIFLSLWSLLFYYANCVFDEQTFLILVKLILSTFCFFMISTFCILFKKSFFKPKDMEIILFFKLLYCITFSVQIYKPHRIDFMCDVRSRFIFFSVWTSNQQSSIYWTVHDFLIILYFHIWVKSSNHKCVELFLHCLFFYTGPFLYPGREPNCLNFCSFKIGPCVW